MNRPSWSLSQTGSCPTNIFVFVWRIRINTVLIETVRVIVFYYLIDGWGNHSDIVIDFVRSGEWKDTMKATKRSKGKQPMVMMFWFDDNEDVVTEEVCKEDEVANDLAKSDLFRALLSSTDFDSQWKLFLTFKARFTVRYSLIWLK